MRERERERERERKSEHAWKVNTETVQSRDGRGGHIYALVVIASASSPVPSHMGLDLKDCLLFSYFTLLKSPSLLDRYMFTKYYGPLF